MTSHQALLLVEDNEDDVFLMKRALQSARILNPLIVVGSGQEAMDYLSGGGKFSDRATHPLPVMILLDLKLPSIFGHEVLAWIRQRKEFEALIVIVLTSSTQSRDLSRCYSLGANSYLIKPPTAEQLNALAKAFKWPWLEYEAGKDNAMG